MKNTQEKNIKVFAPRSGDKNPSELNMHEVQVLTSAKKTTHQLEKARHSKRVNLDTMIVFRWRSDREAALREYAEGQKGVSLSTHIRILLDNYCVRLGIVK